MILITIRFLASSGMLITVGDFAGIHKKTAGNIYGRFYKLKPN